MTHWNVHAYRGLLCRAACAAIALCGCDDDRTRLNSGVARDKALSQLTEGELAQICDATLRYGAQTTTPARIKRAQCVVEGLNQGELQACNRTSAACLNGPVSAAAEAASSSDVSSDAGACGFPGALGSCAARVDMFEGCLEAALGKAATLLDQISCDLLANGSQFAARAAAVPSACEALDRSCPGLGSDLSRFETADTGDDASSSTPGLPKEATCPALAVQYDAQSCSSDTQCEAVTCTCGKAAPQSFQHCNTFRGCMNGLDCDVVCRDSLIISTKVRLCAMSTACQRDEECGPYHCAISGSTGSCTRGELNNACDEDADCSTGKCEARSATRMVCVRYGGTGSECTDDDECQSGICYDFDFSDGRCSDGAAGAACEDDDQCVSGPCVSQGFGEQGICTDRTLGSRCNGPSECNSGFCVYAGTAMATCRAGAIGDLCDDANDCHSGFCVGTDRVADPPLCREGAAGDPCSVQSDCASQICILSDDDSDDAGTCGYQPGAQCPGGRADCDGKCATLQGTCAADNCSARCGSGSCTGQTLATWNFEDKYGSIGLSGGNLVATSATNDDGVVRATIGKSTGKWYWEITLTNGDSVDAVIGVANASPDLDWGLGNSNLPGVAFGADGYIYTSNNQGEGEVCGYSEGQVIGVALDVSTARVYFSNNGAWLTGSDPATNTGGRPTGLSGMDSYPAVSPNGTMLTANFGQSAFKYPPPSGYSALY